MVIGVSTGLAIGVVAGQGNDASAIAGTATIGAIIGAVALPLLAKKLIFTK
jgi:hypothetical protein